VAAFRHPPACPRARGRSAAVLRWASREPALHAACLSPNG
jgi:hypothetical protein